MFAKEKMLRIAAKVIAYFFSPKNMHEMYLFFLESAKRSSVIFDTRVIFAVNVVVLQAVDNAFSRVWCRRSLCASAFYKKGPSERREKRRLYVIVNWKESLSKRWDFTRSILRSIWPNRMPSRYAWRQHHRGCPGRRFGCPAPSVGMRTHQWLTVCPIVSTYRYTHGNLSQELVAIVIN